MSRLEETHRATQRLTSPGATWQQTLTDGVQDLVADVEHDLQQRLRTVARDVDALIEQGDPRDEWSHVEAWLRRRVAEAAIANQDLLSERARELSSWWRQGSSSTRGSRSS